MMHKCNELYCYGNEHIKTSFRIDSEGAYGLNVVRRRERQMGMENSDYLARKSSRMGVKISSSTLPSSRATMPWGSFSLV